MEQGTRAFPVFMPFLNRLLHWFAVGVSTSVLSLLMLSKGGTVETLGYLSSIYAVFVVVFEFPSGVLSDLIGQKKIYLISVALSIAGYAILFATGGVFWLCLALVLSGVARAFSSGSIDAFFISEYIRAYGKEKLHALMSLMQSGEVIGLAVGALAGGIIPNFWARQFPSQNKYNGNLAIQILVLAALFCVTLFGVRDRPAGERRQVSFWGQIRESLGIAARDRNILLLIAGSAVWGFCFNAIELYWQPNVKSMLGSDTNTTVFGLINSGYFLASLVGIGLMTLAYKKFKVSDRLVLVGTRFAVGLFIAILSYQKSLVPFASIYLFMFMLNGMMNIPESTIINSLIPDENRSSILSLSSLTMQTGGIVGALISSAIIGALRIQGLWLLAGIVFAFSSLLYIKLRMK